MQDQSRLLKRKEQNRAAQRAFRERKEKHVKDVSRSTVFRSSSNAQQQLEDRVASLEAKNEQAVSENENLRDLLSRLQNENVMLKEATFTFSVPKNGMNSIEPPPPSTIYGSTSPMSHDSPLNLFDNMSSSSSITSSPPAPPQAVFPDDPFDWNSLMSFDPAALTLLDENPQYATADMSVDFGAPLSPKLPYTTIASNPAFMSFADAFDGSSNIPISDINFDMPPWNTSPQSTKGTHDMFNGNGYMPQQNGPLDYGIGLSPPSSVSPVLHGTAHPNLVASSSSSSDPSTTSMFTKPGDGTASIPDEPVHKGACPNSKEALEKHIVAAGPSPFAPTPSLRKSANEQAGPIIDCQGAVLPQIEKSDQNIEVLAALRSITSNPMFKVGVLVSYVVLLGSYMFPARRMRISPNYVQNLRKKQSAMGKRLCWSHKASITSSKRSRSSAHYHDHALLVSFEFSQLLQLIVAT